MGSNRIVLIVIFLVIGYFLMHREKPGPVAGMFDSLKNVFSTETRAKENPYKAKENEQPKSETPDIIDDISGKVTEQAENKINDFFDGIKDRLAGSSQDEVTAKLPENLFPISSNKLEIVKHKAYVLGYSEPHEQSAWAFHELTKESTYGNASRDGLSFMPDNKVSTSSALSSDYTGSGYDRGHLVPAADFKCCQDLMEDTFWVSNVTPQNPDCNRSIWNSLEQEVRNWARRKKQLYVFTGPVLKPGLIKIGRYNRVSVPEQLFKIVVYVDPNNPDNIQTKAYLIPNSSDAGLKFSKYRSTIDAIELATGLDFFASLPDATQKKLEQNISLAQW